MNILEKRIIFSFSIMSLLLVTMTVLTLVQVNQLTESTRRIQHVLEPSREANLRITIALNTSIISLQNWILMREDQYIRQRKALWAVIGENFAQLKYFARHWNNSEHIKLLDSIAQDLILFQKQQQIIESAMQTQDRVEALRVLKEDLATLNQNLTEKFRRILDPQSWEMERVFVEEEQKEQTLKNTALAFLALSMLFTAILGVLLTRSVIMPLNRTIQLAESIAKGDYLAGDSFSSGEEKLDMALKTMTSQLYEKELQNQKQQTRLEKYNQKLEASNEELSQFSYRTSHDLKAPLITVRGLAEAIREDIDQGDYQEAKNNAGVISVHVRKLEYLITDILDLAKADLKITDKEKINILDVVFEIEQKLKSVYLDSDVEFKLNIHESAEVYISRVRIAQILENLISNAIKYRDKEKPSRYVKVSMVQEKEKTVFIVEDNGIGIPDEFSGKVFKMFQRFHPKIAYGSGLGMYIIKKHVDKMNGKINFISSCNGTRFILEIPNDSA